ncbi:MAG: hypothetical protein WCE44_12200 [Candidatus Velthaea sp.]|jgi:hypothetical protein
MPDTFTETVTKLQDQSLDALKKIQNAQLETLSTIRKFVAELPTPALPTSESFPTIEKIVELNTTFATAVFEQQKAFATQLGNLFGSIQKDATAAYERLTKPGSSAN